MPFPWTKKRVTRISQIVADLQSPKHGGSLVVETGFPTSLIDLFVKNRSRFRKSKSKKRVSREISDPPPPQEPPETPSSSNFTVVSAELLRAETPSSTLLVTGNVNGDDGVAGSGHEDDGSGSKTVLGILSKMLVVVVLIVSLQKFTVGITVSAFALVFLENAGKRVVLFTNANVEEIIKFLSRGIFGCVLFQNLQLKIKQGCEATEPAIVEGDDIIVSKSLSFEEIEVVEANSEVSFAGPKLDCVTGDKKCDRSEGQEDSNGKAVGSCDEVCSCETKSSHSVKLKSMVKKLLPKKLRGSRKEGKKKRGKENKVKTRSEGSSLSAAKEDKQPSFEIKEEQKEEVENGNRSALLLKIKQEDMRENEVDHAVTFSQECSLARVEEVKLNSEEKKRIDKVGNSGYIILFVIALVGLVVGRFPALMLTMTWCFVLKIVTTRGRLEMPLIKCSIPNS